MKKILLLTLSLFLLHNSYAGGPLKFRAGVMALGANHWLLSSDYKTTDAGNLSEMTWKPQFTFNFNAGFAFGLNFTDALGIEVDVILGKYKQDWIVETKDPLNTDEFKYTTEIEKIDIPVLFKAGGLMYVEIGPQFTIINGVEEVPEEGEPFEATDFYASSNIFAILGTGASFEIPKIARIDAGLRLGYGFSDLNVEEALLDGKPVNQAFWGIKLAAVHEF